MTAYVRNGKMRPVQILFEETLGLERINEPVTIGVPFPRGVLFRETALVLQDSHSECLPLQAEVTDRWSDDSCRWVLLDFQACVAANGTTRYTLASRDSGTPITLPESVGVVIDEVEDAVCVNTGTATFWLNRIKFQPLMGACVNGSEILDAALSRTVLTDQNGRLWIPKIRSLRRETSGPLRTTLRFEGAFLDDKNTQTLGEFSSRLHFFARHSVVKMEFTLRNPRAAKHLRGLWDLGDPGSIYFKDLSLHLKLAGRDSVTIKWSEDPKAPLKETRGSVLEIYQASSGGQNWRSRNHLDRFGNVPLSFCGYKVNSEDVFLQGDRAQPTVIVSGENASFAVALDSFWQNFPKAVQVNDGLLAVKLFPAQYANLFELQGGEQKTHTVYLSFAASADNLNTLACAHEGLIPSVDPESYAESGVFPYMVCEARDPNGDYVELIQHAIAGKNNLFERREIIDEYGWRNFGELYADHEAAFYEGPVPLISHYNNQYDAIFGFAQHYARAGDTRWFRLMRDLARHVVDIDIYHTHMDKSAYSGGLFWHTAHYTDAATCTHRTYSKKTMEDKALTYYGGGPSNEHLYTTGLMTFYFLTGDIQAKEAVVGLADWVIRMDDGALTPLRLISRAATGLASQTASSNYHGPGRGAANCINALLDAFVLTRNPVYLDKAEVLIRRCIHPMDDIEALNLRDIERRWSYLVFLQALGKYLDFKTERFGPDDDMVAYAKASLLHYARWIMTCEVPYSKVMDQLEYPTETWIAQDLRKSNVLEWAGKYSLPDEREKFFEQAVFFYQNCLTELNHYDTKTYTRPLVLLLHYGCMHSYFQLHQEIDFFEWRDTTSTFGFPQRFKPQRAIVEARLKILLAVGVLCVLGLIGILLLL